MPMQMGTLMVTIRAQDFASRTLRRVAGEFTAMSREQRIAMQADAIAAAKSKAQTRVTLAESNMRRLSYIQEGKALEQSLKTQTAALNRFRAAQEAVQVGGIFAKGAGPGAMKEFRAASRALDDMGLNAVKAAQRFDGAFGKTARNTRQWADELRRARAQLVRTLGPQGARAYEGLIAAERNLLGAQNALNVGMNRGAKNIRDLRAALATAQAEMGTATAAWTAVDSAGVRQVKTFRDLEAGVAGYHAGLREMGPSTERLARDTFGFNTAMTRAKQELNDAYAGLTKAQKAEIAFNDALAKMPLQRLDNIGHIMGGIGRTMQLFGAVGTVSLGLAAKSFADFNKQVTLAATQTRPAGAALSVTAKNAEILSNQILKLMTEFPASAEEMSQAAYDIYSSMDVSFTNGMKLLKMFNRAAVAGGVDLNTATQASISILENFDKQLAVHGQITGKTNRLMQRMFAIIRYGRMNFSQFNQMLNQVVPAAVGAQQSLDDVAGAMALMTRHMPSQRQAATAIARGLDILTDRDFQNGMKKLNLSITDTKNNLLPLPQIVEKLFALKIRRGDLNNLIQYMTAFGRGKGQGRQSTIQARKFWKTMLTNIEEYRTVQGNVLADNNEMNASFASMSQTMGVRWQVFINQLKVLILYIGQAAMPVFIQFGEYIKDLLDRWNGLSKGTRDAIVRFAAWAAIGSLLAGVILSIVGALASFTAAMINFWPNFSKFFTAVSKTLVSLRGIAAIGTITIGVALIKKGGNWQYLGALLSGFGVGMLRGGVRGGAIGATIGIAATLAFKGNGWQSKLGQILMGAATGFAFGGPEGALLGGAVATIPILVQNEMDYRSEQKVLDQFNQQRKYVERELMRGGTSAPMASALAEQLAKDYDNKLGIKYWSKKGLEAATSFYQGWLKRRQAMPEPGGPHDAFISRPYERMGDATAKASTSLQSLIKGAGKWTLVAKAMADQTSKTVSEIDKLALAIARAFSRGNVLKAQELMQAFATKPELTPTDANVMKEFMRLINKGDLQGAVDWMNKYRDAVQNSKEEWKQYNTDMKQYNKDMLQYNKDMKQYYDDMAKAGRDAATEVLDSMRNMYQQLEDQNRQAMGELGQGPWLTSETFDLAKEWGITPRATDLLKDMNMQLTNFRKRNSQLATLAKRGVPAQMLDELRKMPPDQANPLLEALMKAPPGMIAKIARTYGKMQNEIKKQTKIDFTNEMKQFKTAGLNMAKALTQGFQDANLQKWFDGWARSMFPDVINAAVRAAIRDFKKTGQIPQLPEAPKQPTRRVTGRPRVGHAPLYGGTYTGAPAYGHPPPSRNVHTGATYNYTFNQTFHGEAGTGAKIKENAKKAAFHARNATRGKTGGGGGGGAY